MPNHYRFLSILLIATISCSPKTTIQPVGPQEVIKKPLLAIGDEEIQGEEFLYMLSKNRQFQTPAEKIDSLDFYTNLELFINYKLKVREAVSLGLDKTEEFSREFEMFKDDLTQPFLIKNSLQEGELMKAYNRMKDVIKASHILLQFPPNASQADTVSVLKMALKLKEEAEAGTDFNQLAAEHSDDPSAKDNRGSLGYFTALQMVSAFEDAAYNLQIGQISDPILTDFGYHIIKLEDRMPNPGEIKVSHILVRSQGTDPVSEERALRKVSEIYTELQKPESSWEELCALYSEDPGTKNSGGSLPWISLGTVIPEFERSAFSLQEEGEISAPTRTPFGYHIIRLEERRPLSSYEELEPMIKSRVLRDTRSTMIQSQVLAIQKSRYGFLENEANVEAVNRIFGGSSPEDAKKVIEERGIASSALFVVSGETKTVEDFLSFLDSEQLSVRGSQKSGFTNVFDRYVSSTLQEAEINDLMANNEEYKLLIQEYRDGILLFSLMNEQVWQKAIEDSLGQMRFYQEHLDRYQWGERIQALILTMGKEESIPSVRRFLADKKYLPNLSSRLENTFLINNPLAFTYEEGVFEWAQHPMLRQLDMGKSFHELKNEGKTHFVILGDRIPPGPKKFEETRGKVIQDYQEFLDKSLVERLRETYKVQVNEDEKRKLYQTAVGK
jgi:peptidyl-prolyl cis-trans isomerase SurA